MTLFALPHNPITAEPVKGGLRGIIPPIQTPTLEEETQGRRRINLDAVEQLYQHLVEHGANGVFVAGGVGRGAALDLPQTESLVKRWLEVRMTAGQDKDSFPILINVGRRDLQESKAFAEMAARLRVDGMFWLPTAKPDSVAAAIDHMKVAVSAAQGIPLYWYHIPSVTGTFPNWRAKDIAQFIEQAETALRAAGGTFGGLKCTVSDAALVAELARRSPEFLILGHEATVLDGFVNGGGRAVVNLTACFSSKPYREMLAAINRKDLGSAQIWQDRMADFLDDVLELTKGDMKRLVENGHHLITLAGVPVGNMFDGDNWDAELLGQLHRRASDFRFEDLTGVPLQALG